MRMEHTALYVRDLEAAKDFFVKYLAGRPGPLYHNRTTGFKSYFIAFDGGARLELMTRPDLADAPGPGDRPGFAHVAFSVGDRERVDALTERLRADGWPVLSGPRVTGDGYYESCVAAVEGNRIEITV